MYDNPIIEAYANSAYAPPYAVWTGNVSSCGAKGAFAPFNYVGIDGLTQFQKQCTSLQCNLHCQTAANRCFADPATSSLAAGKRCLRNYAMCLDYC